MIAATLAVGGAVPPPVQETVVRPILRSGEGCTYCEAIAGAFGEAHETIDLLLASLDLDGNPLVDEMLAAHARGVRIRILMDCSDWSEEITERNRPAIDFLRAQGIDARFDDPEVTTHAKLAVVDRSVVVLGSTNWNRYALEEHRQADVRIDDPRLAAAFVEFFERLWEAPGGRLEWTFEGPPPDDGPAILALPDAGGSTLYGTTLLDLISEATTSIHASLYRVSVYPDYLDSLSNRLVGALIAAANRGLDVRVLMDDCRFYEDSATANLYSALFLAQNGVPVRFDRPEVTTHAKLVIVDEETVVLGSTNWNYYSVEQNVEANVALVHLPEVAASYEAYFEWLWCDGRDVGM